MSLERQALWYAALPWTIFFVPDTLVAEWDLAEIEWFCTVHTSKVFSVYDKQPAERREEKEKACVSVLLPSLVSPLLQDLCLVSKES